MAIAPFGGPRKPLALVAADGSHLRYCGKKILIVIQERETHMNKFTIVVALTAVFVAMAEASRAGSPILPPSFSWTEELTVGFNEPNLMSFTYRLGGVQAMSDIMIVARNRFNKAIVSQSTKFELVWDEETETEIERPIPTPWLISMPTRHKAVDTHFLFAMPGVLVPGSVFSETNDKSNPAGIPAVSGYTAGLGTFSNVGGFAFASPLLDGTAFMQVVVPRTTWGPLAVSFITPINGVDTRVWLWTPEPGTVAMLIAGAGCLGVLRFRKRARRGTIG
jgi:hypothetical protein